MLSGVGEVKRTFLQGNFKQPVYCKFLPNRHSKIFHRTCDIQQGLKLAKFYCLSGRRPKPLSFKFHNFTISTERLEILFPGRSTFSTFVSEPTFGSFKLYLLSLVKKMVSLNKFKVQINQFKLKLRIILELQITTYVT